MEEVIPLGVRTQRCTRHVCMYVCSFSMIANKIKCIFRKVVNNFGDHLAGGLHPDRSREWHAQPQRDRWHCSA